MPINAPDSTLTAIQIKVRRLTRTPSVAQLSDDDLNNYINTFIVYDFPEHLRTFKLRTTFNFWCNPFQDVYYIDEISYGGAANADDNSLFNFQNKYIAIHTPLYIAGFNSFYTQSPEQFYGIYPQTNNIQSIGLNGNGATTQFTGVVPILFSTNNPLNQNGGACLVKNNVLFSAVDLNGNGLSMVDVPVLDSVTGNPTVWGNLYPAGTQPAVGPLANAPYPLTPNGAPNTFNYINYITGAFTVTFNNAPATGSIINVQSIPQVVALPQALLFYDNTLTIRPVPDQPYQINFEVDARPTQFLETNQSPQLEEWWQYIAYGAAKKILEDRMDAQSVALILPEFKKQEALVLRRTIDQYTNERVATIYTEQTQFGSSSGQWGWSGSNF